MPSAHVCGLYSTHLNNANPEHASPDGMGNIPIGTLASFQDSSADVPGEADAVHASTNQRGHAEARTARHPSPKPKPPQGGQQPIAALMRLTLPMKGFPMKYQNRMYRNLRTHLEAQSAFNQREIIQATKAEFGDTITMVGADGFFYEVVMIKGELRLQHHKV
jgi:hypothetical protein